MRRIFILAILMMIFTACDSGIQDTDETSVSEESESIKNRLTDTKFLCDDLVNNKFVLDGLSNMVYDGKIYNITFGEKTFSNYQHCMVDENYSDVKLVLTLSAYGSVYVKDGVGYNYNNENGLTICCGGIGSGPIALEDGVVSFYLEDHDYTNIISYLVLKDDGNIYRYKTVGTNIYDYEITDSSEIVYGGDDYGFISYFYYDSSVDKSIINLIMYTKNGLYELRDKEDCSNFVDVKCEKQLIKNEEFEIYKDEIIYFNRNFVVDKDFNFYYNDFFNIEYIP